MPRKLAAAAALALSFCVLPGSGRASAPPAAVLRSAPSIKVAILPVVAAWEDRDEKGRRAEAQRGTEELAKIFTERDFDVLSLDATTKLLADLKIDLGEPSAWTHETLERVGKALGADWVVFVSVTKLSRQRVSAPITDTDELVTCATTRAWLLDRSEGRSPLTGEEVSCPRHSDPGGRKPRGVVAGAVREALRSTLAPYPVKKDRVN